MPKADIEQIESFTDFEDSIPVILQKHQFLNLETLIEKSKTIEQVALDIIRIYGKDTDFSELAAQHRYFRTCQQIMNFDYEKFGSITIQSEGVLFDDRFTIIDGNHRSLTLSVLMLSERIDFKPIPANLVILVDSENTCALLSQRASDLEETPKQKPPTKRFVEKVGV